MVSYFCFERWNVVSKVVLYYLAHYYYWLHWLLEVQKPEKNGQHWGWTFIIEVCTGFSSSWAATCHLHSFELHVLAQGWSRSWSSCWWWRCCPPSRTCPASSGCSSETPLTRPQPVLLSLSHDFLPRWQPPSPRQCCTVIRGSRGGSPSRICNNCAVKKMKLPMHEQLCTSLFRKKTRVPGRDHVQCTWHQWN